VPKPEIKAVPKKDGVTINVGFNEEAGQVVLQFGRPIAWLGLDPQECTTVVNNMIKACRQMQARAKLKKG